MKNKKGLSIILLVLTASSLAHGKEQSSKPAERTPSAIPNVVVQEVSSSPSPYIVRIVDSEKKLVCYMVKYGNMDSSLNISCVADPTAK